MSLHSNVRCYIEEWRWKPTWLGLKTNTWRQPNWAPGMNWTADCTPNHSNGLVADWANLHTHNPTFIAENFPEELRLLYWLKFNIHRCRIRCSTSTYGHDGGVHIFWSYSVLLVTSVPLKLMWEGLRVWEGTAHVVTYSLHNLSNQCLKHSCIIALTNPRILMSAFQFRTLHVSFMYTYKKSLFISCFSLKHEYGRLECWRVTTQNICLSW